MFQNEKYTIRRAVPEELELVMALIASGREIMHSSGNPDQWPEGTPSADKVRQDIQNGNSYLVLDKEVPVATFAFIKGPDPTYSLIVGGEWLNDDPYYVIHRIAKSKDAHGVFRAVMDWCFERSKTVRIDTHKDNTIMQHCISAYGFSYCGIIYLENGDERLAFQKTI